jgi:hypothetical protein
MKLSQNFTLAEFTHSNTAKANIEKFKEQFNPPQNIIDNLKYGAENIAEVIRKEFGSFSPTCVYRSKKLNDSLPNASKTSMHLTGEAMDVTFRKNGVNISNKVFWWLVENKKTIPFTELIWEKGNDVNPQWLHIGWKKQNEQEIFRIGGDFNKIKKA